MTVQPGVAQACMTCIQSPVCGLRLAVVSSPRDVADASHALQDNVPNRVARQAERTEAQHGALFRTDSLADTGIPARSSCNSCSSPTWTVAATSLGT